MTAEAPLSNGQLYSWREIESYPQEWKQEANLPATWDLRGRRTEQVTAALRRLVSWHEALRTTYHLRDGQPAQEVHDDVAPPIATVDRIVTDIGDPDRTTTELVSRPFAMTGDLCWRGVLVSTRGRPMFLSLSFSHLIVDVWSVHELEAQFCALLADPEAPEVAARIGPSPREMARRQRDEQWRSRQASAERYWQQVLDDELVHDLPTIGAGAQRERIQATLHSHQLGGMVALAAREHRLTAPAVLMALVTAGLAEHTGAARVAMSLMASNRFLPEYRKVIGTLNQLIPVVAAIDPGASLTEHMTRMNWAGAKAYRHSCYDVDRIAELAAATRSDGDPGCWFNDLFQCWFNYLQLDDEPGDAHDRRPAELEWSPAARPFGQPFDVRVSVRGGRTSVALRADPDVIPAGSVLDILRGLALGAQRAVTEPESRLQDLWTGGSVPPSLFPQEVSLPG